MAHKFFTDEFEALSDQEKWDVLTALRGPDDDSSAAEVLGALRDLKASITARIRVIIINTSEFEAFMNGYEINCNPLTLAEVEVVQTAITKLHFSGVTTGHFIMHLRKAMRVLGHSPIWGGYGPALLKTLGG